MKIVWLCVVLSKSLCERGESVAEAEMKTLFSNAFVDFRLVDDGFGEDCYSFVKCHLEGDYLEKLSVSPYVVTVLSSYKSPTYLSDDEVENFLLKDEKDISSFNDGDIVRVVSKHVYKGLWGIVVFVDENKIQVLFRFHTVSRWIWFENSDLCVEGSVFNFIKGSVKKIEPFSNQIESSVSQEARGVNSCEFNWRTYRPSR